MIEAKNTKSSAQAKAERTTEAATSILNEERRASDAKVARLRELRLARQAEFAAVPVVTPAPKRTKTVKRKVA